MNANWPEGAGFIDVSLRVVLTFTALLHVPPVMGVTGAAMLTRLYGIDGVSDETLILMRHRAVLFGLMALVIFAGVVDAHIRPLAVVVALVSLMSFLVLARGAQSNALRRVVTLDAIALVALVGCTAGSLVAG
jgi:hypothetical protein